MAEAQTLDEQEIWRLIYDDTDVGSEAITVQSIW